MCVRFLSSGRNLEGLSKTVSAQQPEHFSPAKLKNAKLLLEANVNLGNGKTEKLVIYQGEIDKQISTFVSRHSKESYERFDIELSEAATKRLYDTIKKKIKYQ